MGIGAAIAEQVVARGGRVSVVDLEVPEACDWWIDLPPAQRGNWDVCDLSDREALQRVLPSLGSRPFTGFVAAAGISASESFLDFSSDTWRRTFEINVTATAALMSAVATGMIAHNTTGAMVTLSSTAAFGHVHGLGAAYHASKGAVVAMTRALAGELAPHGIRVNSVAPSVVRTPMTEAVRTAIGEDVLARRSMLGRIATAEEVADVVSYLLSREAGFVTGTVIPVEGGQLALAAPAVH